MVTAKKLPSGSWNCIVYDYSETVRDENGIVYDKNGKPKKKRIYKSFTSDDPTYRGKKEVEYQAAQYKIEKEYKSKGNNQTLAEDIDKFIESRNAILSQKTVEEYEKIKKNAFQSIMDIPRNKLTIDIIQKAVNEEAKRKSKKSTKNEKTISTKTVLNEFGLISTVIKKYNHALDLSEIDLPKKSRKIKELIPPETIMEVIKDTPVELPCMIAMWLSFSMSEIRGLNHSSISPDGYLSINQVVVDVKNKPVEKQQAKVYTRIRKHKIPDYIMDLINKLPSDQEYLVTLSGRAINGRFANILKKNGLPHMTFHDLRHVNASVMALLHVPDRYAMERGGWKTDSTMKKVYTHTFSKEREDVDKLIDSYFLSKMQNEMQNDDEKTT